METEIFVKIKKRATELIKQGKRVFAYKRGILPAYPEPAIFTDIAQVDDMVYDKFCSVNLSKMLIGEQGEIAVFMRPCDTFSLNMLVKENKINREAVYVIGIGCGGMFCVEDGEENGLLEACLCCEKTEHAVYDELIHEEHNSREKSFQRFHEVEVLEKQTLDERYAFWQKHLSRCIRCNACRNICPSCHCKRCVFDNDKYDVKQKVNVSAFEEQMFHIIRAYHVAGRCSDCGQCKRVCPQNIPLHLLNRKFINDINTMYGEFQAGADSETPGPLSVFNIENDTCGG